ncbi:Bromodomain-containing protein [Artomyces pyxidatus]|uniref:Bromodomain-containing protein n=1 Tax=Artomyces pyxidatus TaxID=48021 RepID=A0ACB8TK59_9AGAM|nr:Bromodomain-containing protein [Artomyces pyxidatus]
MAGTRARRAASDPAPPLPPDHLNNLECLILAQAVYELGCNAWPGVSKILSEHPLISRPKSTFSPQYCQSVYEHLLSEAELQSLDIDQQPRRGPSNLKLAQKFYQARVFEVRDLIVAAETEYRTVASEIDAIRSGAWDTKIKAKLGIEEDVPDKPLEGVETEPINEEESQKASLQDAAEADLTLDVGEDHAEEVELGIVESSLSSLQAQVDSPLPVEDVMPVSDEAENTVLEEAAHDSEDQVADEGEQESPPGSEASPVIESSQNLPPSDAEAEPENIVIDLTANEPSGPTSPSSIVPMEEDAPPEDARSIATVEVELEEPLADSISKPEVAHVSSDASEPPLEDAAEAPQEDAPAIPTDEILEETQETPEDVVEVVAEDAAETVTEDVPEAPVNNISEDPADNMSEGLAEEELEGPPEDEPLENKSEEKPDASEEVAAEEEPLEIDISSEQPDALEGQEVQPSPENTVVTPKSPTDMDVDVDVGRRDYKRKASEAASVLSESSRERKKPREESQPAEEEEAGPSRRRPARSAAEITLSTKKFQSVIIMLHSQISQHRNGNIFHNPIKNSEAPDYHDIVKRPMDLKTIKMRIKDGTITNSAEFQRDVYLMFANSMIYNRPKSDIYNMAEEMMLESESQINSFRQTEGFVRGGHR